MDRVLQHKLQKFLLITTVVVNFLHYSTLIIIRFYPYLCSFNSPKLGCFVINYSGVFFLITFIGVILLGFLSLMMLAFIHIGKYLSWISLFINILSITLSYFLLPQAKF